MYRYEADKDEESPVRAAFREFIEGDDRKRCGLMLFSSKKIDIYIYFLREIYCFRLDDFVLSHFGKEEEGEALRRKGMTTEGEEGTIKK